MEKIVHENASPEKCALEAYEATLGPYHSKFFHNFFEYEFIASHV